MGRVVIVGAGPAGAACALYPARAGCQVTVLEAQRGIKSKVCGEGLMPAGAPVLADLGLLDGVLARGAIPFRGIRYRSPAGRSAVGEFPRWRAGVRGLAMPRVVLDGVFADALAAAPGVTVREGWLATEVLADGDRVRGVRARERDTAREETLEADLTIGADGLRSKLHALPGVDARRPRRRRFGVNAHLTGVEGLGDVVEVHLIEGGELYLTPEGGDRAGLALILEEELLTDMGSPAKLFAQVLARADELSRRCARAVLADQPRVLGPLGLTVARACGPGWMLAGDAAGALDPITGEGVALALITARALGAQVQARGLVEAACAEALRHRHRTARELAVLTAALLYVSRSPRIADAAVWTVERLPFVFSRLLGIAAACPEPARAMAALGHA